MCLTSWWVAWLLNFYGFSHTNCMVFYRTPWTRYGIPWNCIGTSGNPMAFHGTPRYSMEFHCIPWNSITTSWNLVELHGIPWNSMDTPWILHGSFVEFHGFPWISMDFHGIPWRYFTRVVSCRTSYLSSQKGQMTLKCSVTLRSQLQKCISCVAQGFESIFWKLRDCFLI